jgi:hypothetical protein
VFFAAAFQASTLGVVRDPEFAAAFDEFRRSHDKLGHGLALGHLMGEWARREVGALGADIRDCVALLEEIHDRTIVEFAQDARERDARSPLPSPQVLVSMSSEDWDAWFRQHPPPPIDATVARSFAEIESGRRPGARLAIAYKFAIVLVRAYQDALARVLRTVTDGVSVQARMTKELKPSKPIGALIAASLPEYEPWYTDWVKLRNQVKYGASVGISQIGLDIGISFTGFPAPEGAARGLTSDRTIFLRDVAHALRQSSAVARLAVGELAKLLDDDARGALAAGDTNRWWFVSDDAAED